MVVGPVPLSTRVQVYIILVSTPYQQYHLAAFPIALSRDPNVR